MLANTMKNMISSQKGVAATERAGSTIKDLGKGDSLLSLAETSGAVDLVNQSQQLINVTDFASCSNESSSVVNH